MTGHAKRFADIMSVRSYEELKMNLLGEFHRAYSVKEVFRQLQARKKKSDETPRQYVVEMQHIADRANVSEEDLIDFIIDGLNDNTTNVTMLNGATRFEQLFYSIAFEKANLYIYWD